MKTRHGRQIAAFLIPILLVLPSAAAAPEKQWSISTKHLTLGPRERIIGFSLRLKSAIVTSLPAIPSGWRISTYNGLVRNQYPAWHTTVDGHADSGLAGIDPSFFNKSFVYIEKVSILGLPFDAQLKIEALCIDRRREFLVPRSALVIVPKELETRSKN